MGLGYVLLKSAMLQIEMIIENSFENQTISLFNIDYSALIVMSIFDLTNFVLLLIMTVYYSLVTIYLVKE